MSDSMDWQNQADSRVEVKADEDEEIDVVGDTPDPLADYGKNLERVLMTSNRIRSHKC